MLPLQEQYTRLFADAEASTKKIEELVGKPEMTDADRTALAAEEAENVKRYARLGELKRAIDARKQAATFSQDIEPEGKGENEGQRKADNPAGGSKTFDRTFACQQIALAISGVRTREFAALTTATASSIFIPASVMPPIVPTQLSAVHQAMAAYGLSVTVEAKVGQIKYPVPGINVGGFIDPSSPSGGTTAADQLTGSFTVDPKPLATLPEPIQNTVLNSGGFNFDNYLSVHTRNWELSAEKEELAVLVAKTTNVVTQTGLAAAGTTYARLMEFVSSIPARFDRRKAIIACAAWYNAVLGMTSDAGNRLVTFSNGTLYVGDIPVYKSDYVDTYGANKIVAVMFCVDAVKPVKFGQPRVNYYSSTARRDHTEVELVNDFGFDAVAAGVATYKCAAT